MKLFFILFLSLSPMLSGASEEARQKLLNAITVCPENTNPLFWLKRLGGNSFTGTTFSADQEAVETTVTLNPQLLNPLIMAPIRLLGTIRVEMTYQPPGYGLRCKVTGPRD